MDELPQSAGGKVAKSQLRDYAVQLAREAESRAT
jgi:hypothetical protein